jgi:hypothetical protein
VYGFSDLREWTRPADAAKLTRQLGLSLRHGAI